MRRLAAGLLLLLTACVNRPIEDSVTVDVEAMASRISTGSATASQ